MIRTTLVALGLLLAVACPCRAQDASPRSMPLGDIFLDLGPRPYSKVVQTATEQAAKQWEMDKGPLYPSTPPLNNDPKRVVDQVIFEGFFYPRSNRSQLAIFSDDGCDLWINGQQVLFNYRKGQHLPTLGQSLHKVLFAFVAGQEYTIRVRYSNTVFLGPTDIDGCTLFAYADGGAVPAAHLAIDLNGDGQITDLDRFNAAARKVGALLIRDKDGVYMDKEEPARRRKVEVSVMGKNATVVVSRGQTQGSPTKDLKLYENEKPTDKEKELFGAKDDFPVAVAVGTPKIYWLQGGPEASKAVRDQFLSVKVAKTKPEETVPVTILWVDISGQNTGQIKTDPTYNPNAPFNSKDLVGTKTNPVYEGITQVRVTRGDYKEDKQDRIVPESVKLGDYTLGVQRYTYQRTPSTDNFGGYIEVDGSIFPLNFSIWQSDDPKKPFRTTDFKDADFEKNMPARAKGFVFRRFIVGSKTYANGQGKPVEVKELRMGNDDSSQRLQDVNPDYYTDPMTKKKSLLIVDVDGPTAPVSGRLDYFMSQRINFDEHVVWSFAVDAKPERCSAKLKWATSMDVGWGVSREKSENLRATAILAVPNQKGSRTNVVLVNEHLKKEELELKLPKPDMKFVNKKTIVRGQLTQINVVGSGLVGEFFLRKGKETVKPFSVAVLVTDPKNHYSRLPAYFSIPNSPQARNSI